MHNETISGLFESITGAFPTAPAPTDVFASFGSDVDGMSNLIGSRTWDALPLDSVLAIGADQGLLLMSDNGWRYYLPAFIRAYVGLLTDQMAGRPLSDLETSFVTYTEWFLRDLADDEEKFPSKANLTESQFALIDEVRYLFEPLELSGDKVIRRANDMSV